MITAFDIGNSYAKAILLNNNHEIVKHTEIPTASLCIPEAWKEFLHFFPESDNSYKNTKCISCVNWKAFLALRVFLAYEKAENFNSDLLFNSELLEVPENSPVVSESMIPLNRSSVENLIGTDRLLAAYAAYCTYKKAVVIVNLGTATTIDLVSDQGEFFSGFVAPGLDVSYEGLLAKASHLPQINQLQKNGNLFGKNSLQSLGAGLFLSQVALIEYFYSRLPDSYQTPLLILTGGRAETVSSFLSLPHSIHFGLVACGLSILNNR